MGRVDVASPDLDALNARFEPLAVPGRTEEILAWAWETFAPKVVASSSFQTQSVPLLHLIAQVCPEMPVLFIDTGFHFPETLSFRDELQARLGLNVVVVRPLISKSELLRKYGEGLYRRDPDLCCYLNKVEPMRRALEGMAAWVSGVRRDQTAHRRAMRVLERQASGLLRIHPMLNWTQADVDAYRRRYDLPAHPLYHLGYRSVGCAPCTRPTFINADPRSGRWAGTGKRECGLHLHWDEKGGDRDASSS